MTALPDPPFDAPTALTLAEALCRIDLLVALTPATRASLRSAVLSTARLLQAEPADLPADAVHLGRRLARLDRAGTGVSRKRRQNIRADLKRALRLTGLVKAGGRPPLALACQVLLNRVSDPYQRIALIGLMRWCSVNALAPDQVTDAVSAAFLEHLRQEEARRDPRIIHQKTCRAWNAAAGTVEGWPPVRLTVPSYRQPWLLPWSAFLESLVAEIERWLARLSNPDPLSEFGPLRPVRPATVTTRRHQVRVWASALVHRGRDPASLPSLASLVEVEAFKEALRFLMVPEGRRSRSYLRDLAVTLRMIAKYAVNVPPDHLAELDRICQRLSAQRSSGITDKNRARLRPLDDPDRLGDLLRFPLRQLAQVRRSGRHGKKEANQIQIALAVEILLMAPMRLANLATLELERHVQWTRSPGRTVVHIVLPGREVKNGLDLTYELPEPTVQLLELYLREYRPALLSGPNRFLFPGRGEGHKAPGWLAKQVTARVHAETGLSINVHLFRHIAGKIALMEMPGDYESVRQLLGHRSLATTVEHYTGVERAANLRRYDALVEGLRAAATAPGRPRRTRA